MLNAVLFGPGGGDALDPLHGAVMDEIHVADALPNRTQGTQQVVAERLQVLVGHDGQPSPGERNGRPLSRVRVADPLSTRCKEYVALNDRRHDSQRDAVVGRRDPGPAGFADVVCRSRVAHLLVADGGVLDLLGEVDLVLEIRGVDLRTVLLGNDVPVGLEFGKTEIWSVICSASGPSVGCARRCISTSPIAGSVGSI